MTGEPERPDLAEELRRRADHDQQARFALGDPPTEDQRRRVRAVDAANTAWLEAGTSDAWLLAQHADTQPDLQKHWLSLLRAAVEAGDADRLHLAYLDDRVAVHQHVPQRHGTQWITIDGVHRLAPLADPQRANEIRTACGLPALEAADITGAWPQYPTAGDGHDDDDHH